MKILHINAGQTGGAAICAKRIMMAEQKLGHECKMLTVEDSSDRDVFVVCEDRDMLKTFLVGRFIKKVLRVSPGYWNLEKMERVFRLATEKSMNVPYVHFPLSKYKGLKHHNLIEWADIIHLHWVSGMIDYPSFFAHVNKPIVWTLHDEQPARGIMHFQSEYSPLPKELSKLDKRCETIKRKALENVKDCYIVALSEYMRGIIEKSPILGRFPIKKIHNGVDTDIFRPYDKQESRAELNIEAKTKVFLFSSFHVNDPRKGLERVVRAIEKLKSHDDIMVLCIGFKPDMYDIQSSSVSLRFMGLIGDPNHLAKIYSASDYFINASYQEAFAQTPLEAMACGVPVISTPCSGAHDLIRDFNGIVCDGFSSDCIAKGIMSALGARYNPELIRKNIITYFSDSIVAKIYEKLYTEILYHTQV